MPLFALSLLACAGASGDALTLDSCVTDVADDVPSFFGTFFRCVTATVEDEAVVLRSDGLPPHPSPYYEEADPNWEAFDDRGGTHVQNPNVLAAQAHELRVPVHPVEKGLTIDASMVDLQAGTSPEEYGGALVGLSLDGTALFHGVAAPGDDIEEERYTFDLYEGHPEATGVYHHHSPNPAALAVVDAAGHAGVELYGIMCDGTVVLGCTELDGAVPPDELDAQGGHVHDMVDADGDVAFATRYHAHICATFGTGYSPEIAYYEGCSAEAP